MQNLYSITVTFEFDTRPPLTSRCEVQAGNSGKALRQAFEIAREALSPISWSSFVCVCLDRRPVEAAGHPRPNPFRRGPAIEVGPEA